MFDVPPAVMATPPDEHKAQGFVDFLTQFEVNVKNTFGAAVTSDNMTFPVANRRRYIETCRLLYKCVQAKATITHVTFNPNSKTYVQVSPSKQHTFQGQPGLWDEPVLYNCLCDVGHKHNCSMDISPNWDEVFAQLKAFSSRSPWRWCWRYVAGNAVAAEGRGGEEP